MTEPSSNTSPRPSAFFDPDSWCWRTSQGSLLSEEYPLLERLPDWGTTAAGALCVQATPEHLTGVRDGSVSPNLPTPVVNDMGRGKTPDEWDSWTDEMKHRHGNGNGHGASLAIEIARLPGIATRLPSNDGNGSSDDQHPTQPIAEDCDPSSSSG